MPSFPVSEKGPAYPPMSELKVHNSILGDEAALNEAWEKDGYWFFRDVLDKESVARLREVYVNELDKLGVTDKEDKINNSADGSTYYNGSSLSSYPYRMEPLMAVSPWHSFVKEPKIHEFFTKLLGDEPFWVPVVEYRATPPSKGKPSRFDGIHQDGPYSPGIPFRICWIPLAKIDEDVGGLCLAEGMTEKVNRHPLVNGSNIFIPEDAIPEGRWKRTTYEAGDVLLVNLYTPHSGMTNVSSRFRLSMDHRVMAKRDKVPYVGTVKSVEANSITISSEAGDRQFRLDADTYVRSNMGIRLYGEQIGGFYTPGKKTIVAHDADLATVVRPQQG